MGGERAQKEALTDAAEIVDRALRRRWAVRVGGVTVALLVAIAGMLMAMQAFDGPDVQVVGQPSEPWRSSWQPLPSHPVNGRVFPTVLWADDRLLVWGGEKPSEGQWHDTGAVFDPSTMTWTDMARAPISARSEHAAVWTGQEMVVCCGRVRGPEGAAAYNPDVDTWRTIPTSPLGNVEFPLAVWTGQEMVVTGGVTGGGVDQNRATAAYNPDTDEWRSLPEIPEMPGARFGHTASAVWTGTEMIVWPSNGPRPLAFNLERARWSELPRPPEDVSGPSLAWTGQDVLAVGSEGQTSEELVALGYRPDTDTWRAITPGLPPADGSEGNQGSPAAVWTGDRMLVWTGYLGTGLTDDGSPVLAYHPANDGWTQLPTAPTLVWRPHLAWTGDHLIAIGKEASLILLAHLDLAPTISELRQRLRDTIDGGGDVVDIRTAYDAREPPDRRRGQCCQVGPCSCSTATSNPRQNKAPLVSTVTRFDQRAMSGPTSTSMSS